VYVLFIAVRLPLLLSIMPTPVLRSMMSKIVSGSEQGKKLNSLEHNRIPFQNIFYHSHIKSRSCTKKVGHSQFTVSCACVFVYRCHVCLCSLCGDVECWHFIYNVQQHLRIYTVLVFRV